MTWSLQLRDGDLNPSGSLGYRVVTGPQKLMQDLRGWILEPRGSDPMHVNYGSILDGGIPLDGNVDRPFIGELISKEAMIDIEVEIRRIVQEYQNLQLKRIEREHYELAGKNTFAPGEILMRIHEIDIRQAADMVVAAVHIQSSNGQTFALAQAIGR